MENFLLRDLALIYIISGLLSWLLKKYLNLPLILGYILSGIIFSLPFTFTPKISDITEVQRLADIGVLLIMFSMGLHFGYRKIKSLGVAPIIIGIIQVLLMWFLSTKVASFFDIGHNSHLFLGAVITTASTTVILKVLEDLQLKSARFAENLIAVLLVEDAVAIFIIIYLTTQFSPVPQSVSILHILVLFILTILLWWLIGTILLPRIIHSAVHRGKDELLIVLSIGLVLGLAFLAEEFKYSPALGAFLMGSILSEARASKVIDKLVEPLRNILGALFFVWVGLFFKFDVLVLNWPLIVSLSLTIIFGKTFFNLILNFLFGRSLKDSIRISGSMCQIGELAFIVAGAGLLLKAIDENIFSIVVAIAIITMVLTPFIIRLNLKIADNVSKILPTRLLNVLEIYTQSVIDFSLNRRLIPISSGVPPFSWLRYLMGGFNSRLKKNFMRFTSQNMTTILDRLAPWDEYLTQVSISFGSHISGKSVLDLKLRETIGVNIVAIERGDYTLVSPDPSELIFPGDTLIVYASEAKVQKLEELAQEKATDYEEKNTLDDCKLGTFHLYASHPFVNKSLAQLKLRENYKCILLAINRMDLRIKNPSADFVLMEDDEIFLFGTRSSLQKISDLQS